MFSKGAPAQNPRGQSHSNRSVGGRVCSHLGMVRSTKPCRAMTPSPVKSCESSDSSTRGRSGGIVGHDQPHGQPAALVGKFNRIGHRRVGRSDEGPVPGRA